jgi:TonB family protein
VGWVVATVLTLASGGDGGTASDSPPAFREPMTRPVLVSRTDFTYPRELLAQRITGLLILRCVITEVGTVEDCVVIKPLPRFTEWALEKLKTARYTPVTLEGRPIRVRYVFNFDVRIAGVPKWHEVRPWRPHVPENIARACRGANAQPCTDTAMSILDADAGPADVDKAGRLLGSACEQNIQSACRALQVDFEAPRMLESLPAPDFRVAAPVEGDVTCLVSAEGRAHDCIAAAGPLSEWVVSRMAGVRFAPARYRGQPFETEHAIRYVVPGRK